MLCHTQIGNKIMETYKYQQMSGRAGRAGQLNVSILLVMFFCAVLRVRGLYCAGLSLAWLLGLSCTFVVLST